MVPGAGERRSAQASPALPSGGWLEPGFDGAMLGAVDSRLKVLRKRGSSPGNGRVGPRALDIQEGYLQGECGVTEGAH